MPQIRYHQLRQQIAVIYCILPYMYPDIKVLENYLYPPTSAAEKLKIHAWGTSVFSENIVTSSASTKHEQLAIRISCVPEDFYRHCNAIIQYPV